jgi:hypothetical protein
MVKIPTNNGENKEGEPLTPTDEVSPEDILKKLEEGTTKKTGVPARWKGRSDINPLTAAEERKRTRLRKNSKKYDGRLLSKNGTISRTSTKAVLTDFYESVRLPDLKQALQVSHDPRYLTLLSMLNNPRFANNTFPELCRRSKMTLQDVVEVWRLHIKNQGIVRMMGHLPDIMEDVAIDSKSRMVVCDKCQGKGQIFGATINGVADPVCPECHGEGTIRLLGDKSARDLTFETVGLKKTGGINVNVAQVNNSPKLPSLEDQISSAEDVFDAEYSTLSGEETDGNYREEGVPQITEKADDDREDGSEAATTGEGDE